MKRMIIAGLMSLTAAVSVGAQGNDDNPADPLAESALGHYATESLLGLRALIQADIQQARAKLSGGAIDPAAASDLVRWTRDVQRMDRVLRSRRVNPETGYGEAKVQVNGREIDVEVPVTPEQFKKGLMNRDSLDSDRGMLFVFPRAARWGVWMKDTRIPLSAAFLRADGAIIAVVDLQPLDETIRYSPEPALFMLETTRGWFERNGVKPGDRVAGLESLPQ